MSHNLKNGQGEVLPNGWQVWVWENPSGGFSYEMRHRGGDQAGGNQKTEAMARKVAGIIADTTIPDPQPVDPAWMVEVAREAGAMEAESLGYKGLAEERRSGELDNSSAITGPLNALRLALSRGHVVLAPVMPSEEEMLADAVEDVVQSNHEDPLFVWELRARQHDNHDEVKSALQARRNVYASLGAVAGQAVSSGPVMPEVDLRRIAELSWDNGYAAAVRALQALGDGEGNAKTLYANEREKDLDAILENLKSGEA
ncbi:hypothetical protein [Methylobacterium indicum]|uniref:Uncharacterized protein n=1 Tax=Methylobacterium indicum TaxID=1775910 RepID=A0ABR5HES8_9HYPH|nr:hypothetical protein [Methylobacterium indicum]KMO18871.1 hypothetical protein QR78_14215 [Methylobacterium indicum]KMO25029.1 hypothetical protein QR79_09605 [Methylobacterium indicum]